MEHHPGSTPPDALQGAAESAAILPPAQLADLPAVFPVQTCSRVLHIGKNETYRLIKAGKYPVRVLDIDGRFRVSRHDLLQFLGYGAAAERTS